MIMDTCVLPDVNVQKIHAFLNLSLHLINHYTIRAYGEAEVQFHAFITSGLHEGGAGTVHSQEWPSYRLDNPLFVSQQWQKNFLSSKMSRLDMGPTQPHVWQIPGVLFLQLKWRVLEFVHLPPSNVEVPLLPVHAFQCGHTI